MKFLERSLVMIDAAPWSAIWRILLGLAIPPVFSAITGGHDTVWTYLPLFLGLLVALRIGPAVIRHSLPISPQVKAIWKKRRFIAKEHDSYQWQKLFWIGLGILSYAAVGDGLGWGGVMIAATCLLGGGAGLLAWIRTGNKTLESEQWVTMADNGAP